MANHTGALTDLFFANTGLGYYRSVLRYKCFCVQTQRIYCRHRPHHRVMLMLLLLFILTNLILAMTMTMLIFVPARLPWYFLAPLGNTTSKEFTGCVFPKEIPCAPHVPLMCPSCAPHVPLMCPCIFVYYREHARGGWQRNTFLNR